MRRDLVLAAVIGISPGIGLYGTSLCLMQRNWVSIDRAATLIELYNMETFGGTGPAQEYATRILETYGGATDRFVRRRGAVNAANEYLRDEKK